MLRIGFCPNAVISFAFKNGFKVINSGRVISVSDDEDGTCQGFGVPFED